MPLVHHIALVVPWRLNFRFSAYLRLYFDVLLVMVNEQRQNSFRSESLTLLKKLRRTNRRGSDWQM